MAGPNQYQLYPGGISLIWSFRLYGQFQQDKTVSHISETLCSCSSSNLDFGLFADVKPAHFDNNYKLPTIVHGTPFIYGVKSCQATLHPTTKRGEKRSDIISMANKIRIGSLSLSLSLHFSLPKIWTPFKGGPTIPSSPSSTSKSN